MAKIINFTIFKARKDFLFFVEKIMGVKVDKLKEWQKEIISKASSTGGDS